MDMETDTKVVKTSYGLNQVPLTFITKALTLSVTNLDTGPIRRYLRFIELEVEPRFSRISVLLKRNTSCYHMRTQQEGNCMPARKRAFPRSLVGTCLIIFSLQN